MSKICQLVTVGWFLKNMQPFLVEDFKESTAEYCNTHFLRSANCDPLLIAQVCRSIIVAPPAPPPGHCVLWLP